MRRNRLGVRGQLAAVDIIFVFIVIAFYAVAIWSFSVNTKAPGTQAQRAQQDFTKSLLLSMLYTTPDSTDIRYKGKSVSDLLAMYLTNTVDVEEDMVMKKLTEAKVGEYLTARDGGGAAQWFLYTEKGGNIKLGSLTPTKREFCFMGDKGANTVSLCPEGKVPAYRSTSASATIVFPYGSSTPIGSMGSSSFQEMPVYLTIVWE